MMLGPSGTVVLNLDRVVLSDPVPLRMKRKKKKPWRELPEKSSS